MFLAMCEAAGRGHDRSEVREVLWILFPFHRFPCSFLPEPLRHDENIVSQSVNPLIGSAENELLDYDGI